MFCKCKKLFQQILKKWQSHKIPTPPFKSYLISFILLCKSQSHLSTTKTCFPSYTLSLVLASLLQPVALALKPARTDHSQTVRPQSNALHWAAKFQDNQFSFIMVVSRVKVWNLPWNLCQWTQIYLVVSASKLLSCTCKTPFRRVDLKPGIPLNLTW